jgi:Cdc6-like AAA superfamily ATPase
VTPSDRARRAYELSRERFEHELTDSATAQILRRRLLQFAALHGSLRAFVDLAVMLEVERVREAAAQQPKQGPAIDPKGYQVGLLNLLQEPITLDAQLRPRLSLAAVEFGGELLREDPLAMLLPAAVRHAEALATPGNPMVHSADFLNEAASALLVLAWFAVHGQTLPEARGRSNGRRSGRAVLDDGGQARSHQLRAEQTLGPCFVRLGLQSHCGGIAQNHHDRLGQVGVSGESVVRADLQAAWCEVLTMLQTQAQNLAREAAVRPRGGEANQPAIPLVSKTPPVSPSAPAAASAEPQLVLITQPIPGLVSQAGSGPGAGLAANAGKSLAGRDREEQQQLEEYIVLTQPLPATPLPELTALHAIQDRLQAEFPWAQRTIEALLAPLLLHKRAGARILRLQPTLLVGRPGGGKSRLARRLAQELGLPLVPFALGGSSDEKLLLGTSRGWSSAQPSAIVAELASRRRATALVLLDEIDKIGTRQTSAASLADILLGLLEPETARAWPDAFLRAPVNLSHLSWVATSNSIQVLSKTLLSRLEPLLVPEPQPKHFAQIVPFVVRDVEQSLQLPAGSLPTPVAREVDTWREIDTMRALQRRVRSWLEQTLDASQAVRH